MRISPGKRLAPAPVAFDDDFVTSEGRRRENQDCVGSRTVRGIRCWVVADGMGGRGGGRVASHLAVDAVLDSFSASPSLSQAAVQGHIEHAHQEIVSKQKLDASVAEMQSTIVVLVSDGRRAVWGHVGDSRLYHFRGGKAVFQTADHSFSQAKVAQGQMTLEQIRKDPDRNLLLQSVGRDGFAGPTVWPKAGDPPVNLCRGDAFLLCVDGFWGLVHEVEMEIDLAKSEKASDWLRFMRLRVDRNMPEGADNYSAYSVMMTTPGLPGPPAVVEMPASSVEAAVVPAAPVASASHPAPFTDDTEVTRRTWFSRGQGLREDILGYSFLTIGISILTVIVLASGLFFLLHRGSKDREETAHGCPAPQSKKIQRGDKIGDLDFEGGSGASLQFSFQIGQEVSKKYNVSDFHVTVRADHLTLRGGKDLFEFSIPEGNNTFSGPEEKCLNAYGKAAWKFW